MKFLIDTEFGHIVVYLVVGKILITGQVKRV